MKDLLAYIILLIIWEFTICGCGTNDQTHMNQIDTITDSLSYYNTINFNSDRQLECLYEDSVWFEDYVKIRQVNPYADVINSEDSNFQDYQTYYDSIYSDEMVISDTLLKNYKIRTYKIRDSIELAYTHKVGDKFYGSPYCLKSLKEPSSLKI